MPDKASGWLNSHMRSCDLVILMLKKEHNPENFNPYQPGVGVRPLLNNTIFNTRLVSD
jgi:hypothetical protein